MTVNNASQQSKATVSNKSIHFFMGLRTRISPPSSILKSCHVRFAESTLFEPSNRKETDNTKGHSKCSDLSEELDFPIPGEHHNRHLHRARINAFLGRYFALESDQSHSVVCSLHNHYCGYTSFHREATNLIHACHALLQFCNFAALEAVCI